MTIHLAAAGIQVVLLDIEGTTTPIEFVVDVLFPFARARTAAYLERERHSESCRAVVALLAEERAADISKGETPPEPVAAYVGWLMDRDRKSQGLKTLQGLVWEAGYRRGDLHGQVFADVPGALERWRARGLDVCIYSSGSVLAQQLLFRTTAAGDLTPLLRAHFDTTVGPKSSPDSYRAIVGRLGVGEPGLVLFVSDVIAELDAAQTAGLRTVLCVRGVEPRQGEGGGGHAVVRSFDEIVV